MRSTSLRALLATLMMGTLGCQGAGCASREAEVQALKEKVALATRMLVMEGLIASSGHVSARIAGTTRVLIGPGDTSRARVTADDIVTVDLDSNRIAGSRNPPGETEIHTGIYRARPDVMAVVHTHPVHSVVFSITGKPIVPVTVHGAIFGSGVPVMGRVGHVNSRELGDRLARTLGPHNAALLEMHGAVVAAPSIEEAFVWALHLEENAEKQLWAEATGEVHGMTEEEIARCFRQSLGRYSILKRWAYYEDKLRRLAPE